MQLNAYRVGQCWRFPWQRCGILKYMVYGQSGGLFKAAVMVESYRKACSSIMVNWLLPPTRKYGALTPTTLLSVRLANFSAMILMPAISFAQSSTVASDQKRSSSLCLAPKLSCEQYVVTVFYFQQLWLCERLWCAHHRNLYWWTCFAVFTISWTCFPETLNSIGSGHDNPAMLIPAGFFGWQVNGRERKKHDND